ncbi:hypothetical protein MRBBS_1560 [Marinobacter sp. BSs20148]|nr:hypothetical protein MRBBS_1560 [Marinobacter sp. BSs20148]
MLGNGKNHWLKALVIGCNALGVVSCKSIRKGLLLGLRDKEIMINSFFNGIKYRMDNMSIT